MRTISRQAIESCLVFGEYVFWIGVFLRVTRLGPNGATALEKLHRVSEVLLGIRVPGTGSSYNGITVLAVARSVYYELQIW